MSDRKQLPGKFVWFQHVSRDAKKAQAFYGEVLGWKTRPFPAGDRNYDMIYAGDTMIGSYAAGQPTRWISYASVEDVDAAAATAAANGGRVVEPPSDIPGVGRKALIADPHGAEVALFKSNTGDPPDDQGAPGRWCWNELHTIDPTSALAFYAKVLGFTHRSMDMAPGGTYHIVSRNGVDRGGVTSHLAGAPPHWLPYVAVDDTDATIARAKKQGATIPMPPEDIPGVGRFGVMQDPTGATLAILKPAPMEKKP